MKLIILSRHDVLSSHERYAIFFFFIRARTCIRESRRVEIIHYFRESSAVIHIDFKEIRDIALYVRIMRFSTQLVSSSVVCGFYIVHARVAKYACASISAQALFNLDEAPSPFVSKEPRVWRTMPPIHIRASPKRRASPRCTRVYVHRHATCRRDAEWGTT